MRLENAPLICVVKKEAKEAKLLEFLRRNIMTAENVAAAGLRAPLLMIARTVESPVARALLAMCVEMGPSAHPVRAIITNDEGLVQHLQGERGEYLAALNCRMASDVRLLDAHELLVLGPASAWIGDCMRRDPSKHDAYEFYSEDAPEASRSAVRSFERIWHAATPLLLRRLPAAGLPDLSAISAEAAHLNAATTATQGATRH